MRRDEIDLPLVDHALLDALAFVSAIKGVLGELRGGKSTDALDGVLAILHDSQDQVSAVLHLEIPDGAW